MACSVYTLYSHPLSAEYDYHSQRTSLRLCNAVSLMCLLMKESDWSLFQGNSKMIVFRTYLALWLYMVPLIWHCSLPELSYKANRNRGCIATIHSTYKQNMLTETPAGKHHIYIQIVLVPQSSLRHLWYPLDLRLEDEENITDSHTHISLESITGLHVLQLQCLQPKQKAVCLLLLIWCSVPQESECYGFIL